MTNRAPSAPARVTVHLATTDLIRPWHEEILSDGERARAARFTAVADHDRFVLGAALVRVLAAERLGTSPDEVQVDRTCARCARPHGRPVVRGDTSACSVSHSGRHVVVAVNEAGAVGVDIEATSGRGIDHAPLERLVLAPGEAVPRDYGEFLTTWTRKEALLKLTGEGLLLAPSLLRLSAPYEAPQVLMAPDVLDGAVVADLPLANDAVAALAVYGAISSIDLVDADRALARASCSRRGIAPDAGMSLPSTTNSPTT